MIFLKSERIILRSLCQSDVEEMYLYRNDPQCSKYQRGQVKKKEEISTLVDRMKDRILLSSKRILLAIADKDSNTLIGEIAFIYDNGTVTLGYTISPKYQRRGYAYEAMSSLLDTLFLKFPRVKVICRVIEGNTASIGLLSKLGFLPSSDSDEDGSLVFEKHNSN